MPTHAAVYHPTGGLGDTRKPEQLALRLFARVDEWSSPPPERALWRELLDLAIRNEQSFAVSGHHVSAADVHHVGLAIYMRSSATGVVEGFPASQLAKDIRRSLRTVRAALGVLNSLHVVRSERDSRRAPARHVMNVGGLDWRAVRARSSRATPPPPNLSGAQPAPLSGAQPAPLKGYGEELQYSTNPSSIVRCACGHSWPAGSRNDDWCSKCHGTRRKAGEKLSEVDRLRERIRETSGRYPELWELERVLEYRRN